jgi:hypothetical protein
LNIEELTRREMIVVKLQHTQSVVKPNEEKPRASTCSGQKKIRAGKDKMGAEQQGITARINAGRERWRPQ